MRFITSQPPVGELNLRTHFFPISGFLLVISLPLFFSGAVHAAPQSCGSSINDDLKQARQVLDNDANQQRAIECLIEAVAKLDADKPNALREDGDRVLIAPSVPRITNHD